jgi:dTDP-L-rhamnose 4-epimerase
LRISAMALRYQNVYGPGQSLSNPYTGILSIFSTRIRNGNAINVFEDGQESRDFVYIDDIVSATTAAVESEKSVVGAFNVGSGSSTSVLRVARELSNQLGLDVPVHISGHFRIGDIRHNVADLTKTKAALGYRPRVAFEEGIGKFMAWVKTMDVQKDKYEESIGELKRKGLYK